MDDKARRFIFLELIHHKVSLSSCKAFWHRGIHEKSAQEMPVLKLQGSAKGLGLSRRQLLVGGKPLAAPALLSRAAFAQNRPLNFLTWGGRFGEGVRAAFSDPFTATSGIAVEDITPITTAVSSRRCKTTILRISTSPGSRMRWSLRGPVPSALSEALDYSLMPHASNARASARQEFGVSPYVTTYQIGFRTDLWSRTPTSWADFWDVETFLGPRSLGTSVMGVLEAALMADGVAPEDLYPIDEERALPQA
ncbi:hypothetical protein [Roseicyclus sp.]|uniref:hypothetical protein n=1 Tax=Roseicyclus sp. TaxID=1914329 RepID=UPI001BCAB747|nr:hypothetical protein [Roseicyclus sp.]